VGGNAQPIKQRRNSILARAKVMPELVSRLGTATDAQLAAAFGLSGKTIFAMRTQMGISKFSPFDKLAQNNPDLVARLGVSTDTQLASEFGWSYESVNLLRRHLGIAKHSTTSDARKNPELLEMFTTIGLDEMAKRTGKSKKTLRKIRKALGIPQFKPAYVFKPASVFTEEVIKALGTAPDPVIATRFGIERTYITKTRMKLGITPFTKPGRPPAPVPAELPTLLGKISDKAISKRFGMSPVTVRKKREEAGIPAYKHTSQTTALVNR
jgi:hypothetical protein